MTTIPRVAAGGEIDAVDADSPLGDDVEIVAAIEHLSGEPVVAGDHSDTPAQRGDKLVALEVLARDLRHSDGKSGTFERLAVLLQVADQLDARDGDLHRRPAR